MAMAGLLIASCGDDSKDEPVTPVGPTTVAVTGVSVSKTTVTLVEGNAETVTATVSPENASDQSVSWKSSDESVATVSNGKITAQKPGTATITVTTADGGKSASVSVTITESELTAQRKVLEDIFNLMEGSKWTNNENWKTDAPLSEWYGVTMEGDHVIGLNLSGNNLGGTLPDILADLPYLKTLVLSDNHIQGEIPASWGKGAETRSTGDETITRAETTVVVRMAVLMILDLSGNNLSGSIPEEIGNLTSLTNLNLDGNNLTGTLPESIVNLTSMVSLSFSGNRLSGLISVVIQKSEMWMGLNEEPDLTQQDGYELEKEIEITSPVTNVTLSAETLELTVGETASLTATLVPSDATLKVVSWTSSDTSVVTITDGAITAVSPGTAVITVTTKDGNKTATCSITVKAPVVAVTGVTLNKTTLTLAKGNSESLTAAIAPDNATDKEVTWSSSRTSVATVDASGKVTAVAAGTATITVSTNDGSKKATCEVTVNVPVTGVTLDNTTLTITVGGTSTLTANVAPNDATDKDVTWSSSDSSVATVNTNGVITAVAAGKATVTVTTKDGNKTATCVVTVEAAAEPAPTPSDPTPSDPTPSDPTPTTIAVTGVILNNSVLNIEVGATSALNATIAPADATNQNVTWSSSDERVATVVNGVITAVAVGEATITVTTSDGNFTDTCKVTVSAKTQVTNGDNPEGFNKDDDGNWDN